MSRMSHEEERVNGFRMGDKPDRAPPHWLNPFVGLSGFDDGRNPSGSKSGKRWNSGLYHLEIDGPHDLPYRLPICFEVFLGARLHDRGVRNGLAPQNTHAWS